MKQNYSLDIIASLFHEYFPEKKIIQHSLCDGGIENSNFLIETADKKYILKIFEATRNTNEVIQSEINIMAYLSSQGCHVPRIFLAQDGRNIIFWPDWKPVVLMDYIDGVKYRDGPMDAERLFHLGSEIAHISKTMRAVGEDYEIPDTHIFDLKYLFLHPELRSVLPDCADSHVLERVWSDIDTMSDVFLLLPRQIIHNDLHSNNIIFYDGKVPYFIDFSDLVMSPRIQDVAVSLVSWCFQRFWYPEGMTEYLRGYEKIDPLTQQEKECLFICIEARVLNIVLTPYLDAWIGDYDEIRPYILEYYTALERLHTFWKEKFMKYIP